jgi:2-alkyl-3-oxoalkanoate reductase
MKIAVTGGSGFLGREIVQQLTRVGHDVIAISRGQTTSTEFSGNVRFIRSDINDRQTLIPIFEGCDIVIHSAALSAPWGKRCDFLRQNVEGTANVVRSAEAAAVQRLILVSSSSVYFSFADKLGMTECCELPRPVNAYAESKQKAETAASEFKGDVFIVRPRGIFGPGDLHLLPRLLRVMKSRPLPLLREGKALVDITDVSVVADAIVRISAVDQTKAGTYNISHGEPISILDLVGKISEGLGISYSWQSLPMAVAFAGAKLLETAAHFDPRQREPLVTSYGLGLFGYSHTLDISKAARELNWKPKLSLHEGLQRTFLNFQEAS